MITLNVDAKITELETLSAKVDMLIALANQIGGNVAGELQRLTQEVAETRTVVQSAITLLNTLSQRIRDLSTDPVALNVLADELDSEQQNLAAAIEANTPAAPTPPTP